MKYLFPVLILFLGLIFAFLTPFKFLLNFSNDDSFFYLKTAYNFASGQGSTFDMVQTTNGYHPLWFLLLSSYFYVLKIFVGFSPELYYRFVVLLTYLICSGILFFLFKIWKINFPSSEGRYLALFTPLLLLFVFTRDIGLETHITCLLITLYILLKSIELSSKRDLIKYKCLLLMLLFLSRIDFLFSFLPILIITDYFTTDPANRKKFLLYSISSCAVIAVIYFSINIFYFGNFMNISGSVKNSFPDMIFLKNIYELTDPGILTNQFAKTIYTFAVIVIFVLLAKSKKFKTVFSEFEFFLLGACIGTLFFLILNLAYNYHSLKEWYVAIPTFIISVLLVRILSLFPRFYYIFLGTFILVFLFHFNLTRLHNPKWDNTYDYAIELKNNTSPNDRIFQIDLCGIVGYFSERNVINGDGLINNFEYQEYIRTKNLKKYFKDRQIKYYSTHSTDKGIFKITLKEGLYTDEFYKLKDLGGFSFTFPEMNLKLKYPYYYYFAVSEDTGNWYVFNIEDLYK